MVRNDVLNINTKSLQIEELYREKFGTSFPSLQVSWRQQERNITIFEEISSHAAFTFTNSEPLIDFAAPTLNRVIAIGGIGAKTPIALDQVIFFGYSEIVQL